jgi:hypothetical protein
MIRVKKDDMDRSCNKNMEKINEYGISVERLEGKRPLVRPKRRWRIIFKLILEGYDGVVQNEFFWVRIRIGRRLL